MLKSMTGFGQSQVVVGDTTYAIEVRSLNSKFLDLSLRLPKILSDREYEFRSLVTEILERGKVSVIVDHDKAGAEAAVSATYNEEVFAARYQELKKLADRVMAPYEPLFQLALQSPGVALNGTTEGLSPEAFKKILDGCREALTRCDAYRANEGALLHEKCTAYATAILRGLEQVERMDPGRVDRIRERIRKSVTDFFGEEGFDQNRLEQELIFYIEKLDIHEERVRLRAHLELFAQVMEGPSNGKKLGFICQEIGREINTIGSKANDAAIQREVVAMKEELEKIKEQMGNIM